MSVLQKYDQMDPLEILLELTQMGDIVPYQTAYGPAYLVNHPDYIEQVLHGSSYVRGIGLKMVIGDGLLAAEGNYWRGQRRLMQPAFHRRCIEGLGALICSEINELLARWRVPAKRLGPVNMTDEMNRLTLTVIGKAMFSVDLYDMSEDIRRAFTTLNEDLGYLLHTHASRQIHEVGNGGRRRI